MSSLVQDLQHDSIDPQISESTLLRKALIVAKKLKIEEFENWISLELDGYFDQNKVPEYRMIGGQLRGKDTSGNYIPIVVEDEKLALITSRRAVGESIREIESFVKRSSGSSTLELTIPHKYEVEFTKSSGSIVRPVLVADISQFMGILDTVRNTVLKWSLKLEEDGIIGKGVSFSEKEKQAASITNYNIKNYIGEVTNSQIQQGTFSSTQKVSNFNIDLSKLQAFIKILNKSLDDLELDENKHKTISSNIVNIEKQLNLKEPQFSIITESLFTIKTVLESAAGSLLAPYLLEQISKLLGI